MIDIMANSTQSLFFSAEGISLSGGHLAPRISCFSPCITKCSISHCISFVTIRSKQTMPRKRSVIRSIFLILDSKNKKMIKSAFDNNICSAHSLGGHNSTKHLSKLCFVLSRTVNGEIWRKISSTIPC